MSLNRATFIARFPEFASTDAALVDAALAAALDEIDETVWGDLADRGQALRAAHELAMGPFGQAANLRLGAGANGTSIYWSRYDDLRRRVGTAYRPVLE